MQKGKKFDSLFLISQLTLLNRTSASTSNGFLKVSLAAQRSATMRDLVCVYVKRQIACTARAGFLRWLRAKWGESERKNGLLLIKKRVNIYQLESIDT